MHNSVNATYGGTFSVSATLTADAMPLDNRTVHFKLNGASIGDASTNSSGVASFSSVALAGLHVGNYAGYLTATFDGDPSDTASDANANLNVTPATLIITADSQHKSYGAAVPSLTASYSGFVNGDTSASLSTQPTISTTATAASHVAGNPYAITASGAVDSDYDISYVAGTLTVDAVALTITADSKHKDYGAALPTLTASYSGFVNNDTSASLSAQPTLFTTATAASHVAGNPYAITASGAVDSDYNISYVAGTLTVDAVALTITADSQHKDYGAAVPTLTASYSGFVNNDTSASLSTQPTLFTTATAASHVAGNPYAITASGVVDADYTISYVDGTLTVDAVALTITADDKSKPFAAPLPMLTASYSGFVNNDTSASLSTLPMLQTTATQSSSSSGNPYPITASGAAGSDYTISYVAGALTVTPISPTVVAPTVANLTINSVTLGGNVTSDGDAPITARGIVYALSSLNNNPQINGASVTVVLASGGTGAFSVDVGSLPTGKSYSFVAYASNSVGTTYTNVGAFTTFPSVGQLAGVTVQVIGHQLVITGDNHADQVQVAGDGTAREYIVSGLNGTIVNGVANGVITTTAIDSMQFNLTNGADIYTLDRADLAGDIVIGGGTGPKTINVGKTAAVRANNVSINGGGNNSSAIEGVIFVNQTTTSGALTIVAGVGTTPNKINTEYCVVGTNLTVTGAAGYDLVQQTQVHIGGNWNVDVGAGHDLISAAGIYVTGDSTLKSGTGIDTIAVAGSLLQHSIAMDGSAGGGPKTITLYSSILFGAAALTGGDGNDSLTFDNNVGPSVALFAGKGVDFVRVKTSILDSLFTNLGDGDDYDFLANNTKFSAGLEIIYTHVRQSTQIDGGNGNDIFHNIGNLFDTPISQKAFEKTSYT